MLILRMRAHHLCGIKVKDFFKMLFFSVSHMQPYSLYSIQVNFNVIMSSITEISWLLFLSFEGPDKEHILPCKFHHLGIFLMSSLCSGKTTWMQD